MPVTDRIKQDIFWGLLLKDCLFLFISHRDRRVRREKNFIAKKQYQQFYRSTASKIIYSCTKSTYCNYTALYLLHLVTIKMDKKDFKAGVFVGFIHLN